MRFGTTVALFAALLAGTPVLAAEPAPEAAITKALAANLPGLAVDGLKVTRSPMEGLYQVTSGPQVYYASVDGRFLIQGELFDVKARRNLTEDAVRGARTNALDTLGEAKMVSYPAKETMHTITVFTDIDCGYCRKLHGEMADYHERGIGVRYVFYPRSGPNTPSYNKAVSVWCAEDRQAAMNQAKKGEEVEAKRCDNPVDEHLLLGMGFNIRGTPAIVTESGEKIAGYVPAARLIQMLEAPKK